MTVAPHPGHTSKPDGWEWKSGGWSCRESANPRVCKSVMEMTTYERVLNQSLFCTCRHDVPRREGTSYVAGGEVGDFSDTVEPATEDSEIWARDNNNQSPRPVDSSRRKRDTNILPSPCDLRSVPDRYSVLSQSELLCVGSKKRETLISSLENVVPWPWIGVTGWQ